MAMRLQRYFRLCFRERRRFLAKKFVQRALRSRLEIRRCVAVRKDLHWAMIRARALRRQKKKKALESDLQEVTYLGGLVKTTVDMKEVRERKHRLRRAVRLGVFSFTRKGRLERAAVLLQTQYRRRLGAKKMKRKRYLRQKDRQRLRAAARMRAIVLLQSVVRGRREKRAAYLMKATPAAVRIQRRFRGWRDERRERWRPRCSGT